MPCPRVGFRQALHPKIDQVDFGDCRREWPFPGNEEFRVIWPNLPSEFIHVGGRLGRDRQHFAGPRRVEYQGSPKRWLVPLVERIEADESLPALARELFTAQATEFVQLQVQIEEVDAKLTAYHRADECSQRLVKIPSVGPIGAMLLRMKTPDPAQFASARQFAAWIGLTPKDHSTAGKVRLGVITRVGDETLRSVLVVGATAVIQQIQRSGKASPWLAALLKRKPPKLAAVALANKTARIAWKMMLTGERYVMKSAAAVSAGAV